MQPARAATSDRLSRVRIVTGPLHRQLDNLMAGSGLLESRRGYAAYLAATYAARRTIETRMNISGVCDIYPAWPTRRLSRLLEEDLRDIAVPLPEIGSPDPCPPMFRGAVLGALYVLEGSALGARVIARNVAALGMGPQTGARHLAHQSGSATAWQNFLRVLDAAPLTTADEEDFLAEAATTFNLFISSYAKAA